MAKVMFKLWAKIFKDNHLIKDTVISNDNTQLNRTKKVLLSLETICNEFDLSVPIWLDSNITEFKNLDKTRFYNDNFIESIDFDFLEIQVLEEDY